MVQKVGPKEFDLLIKFGGGLNTRASEDEINDREAAGGSNFLLDLETRELRPRPPFDLVGTVPNGAEIRGGGSFLKADGTVHAFFQAGDTVYEWDGSSFQASPVLDTVNASSKLRCHWRSHSWTLDDLGIITDLALLEVVKQWDGTTWADVSFSSGVSVSFGAFFAKYCSISNERALFANVKDSGATSPHMIVGSVREDHRTISVSDRPSSSLSESDPFFLLTPDLKPLNGFIEAFRTLILSSEKGRLFNLTGESAQDFLLEDFFPGSFASGEESLCYVGSDIVYGRQGRLESVKDLDRFGDSEADDLTRQIADMVRAYTGWQVVYNSRLNRVYAFPTGQSEVWVINTAMRGGEFSPWMRWTTNHALAFQPTFVMSMLDPADGLEYTFMGDASGNVYRLEGTGTAGDSGTTNIAVEYLTKLFVTPLDMQAYGVEGWIKYRKDRPNTVRLIFEYAGENIFNEVVEVTIPEAEQGAFYGGEDYYGAVYYGSVTGKLSRRKFNVPGQGNEFQVRIEVEGVNEFAITEIGIRFRGTSA